MNIAEHVLVMILQKKQMKPLIVHLSFVRRSI